DRPIIASNRVVEPTVSIMVGCLSEQPGQISLLRPKIVTAAPQRARLHQSASAVGGRDGTVIFCDDEWWEANERIGLRIFCIERDIDTLVREGGARFRKGNRRGAQWQA